MYKTGPRRSFALGLWFLMVACAFWGMASAELPVKAPVLPAGVVDLGVVPASQPVSLTLYLTPTIAQQSDLTGFLKDVVTPGNANYHAWLTPAAFDARFAATAEQMAAINAFTQSAGLTVGAISGLRVSLSGTASQVEAALSPKLHQVQTAGKIYTAATAAITMPAGLVGVLSAVDGLDTLPKADVLASSFDGLMLDGSKGLLSLVTEAAEANAGRVLALSTSDCLEDFDAGTQAAVQFELRQMNAEGVTVLAQSGCGARGSGGFPATLSEVTAVAVGPGITPGTGLNLTEPRPVWQAAVGLPADALRHEVDVTVSSLTALTQTMETILASQPKPTDGTAPRLGAVNATLYAMASKAGLYTQPDNAPTGTWETATGLGLVDLKKLADWYPRGTLSVNVSISMPNYSPTHGTQATFTSTVSDTSGQSNGQPPTGTVTFTADGSIALGTVTLSGGSGSVNYNQLAGGSHTVVATYSGDTQYAAGTSLTITFSVGKETTQLTPTSVQTGATVGGKIAVTLTEISNSGVGAPTGSVTVTPQGTSDQSTYTATLVAGSGSSTATFSIPAVQGGADNFLAACPGNDPSFTCPSELNFSATVLKGTPSFTLTASPATPTAGQTVTFTATVSGGGGKYPIPTGNMAFYNGSTQLGSATLNSATGVATYQTANVGTAPYSFTAQYGGDNNYASATAVANASSPASATTTALTINPTVPSGGSLTTLTATVTYTTTNGATPTGTMSFYEDGTLLGTGTVSTGMATYTSTAITTFVSHTFYSVYSGDTNYLTSTSPSIATSAGTLSSSTTLLVSPNPPVSGSTTTLKATVGYGGVALPTGTVVFYQDGVALSTGTVSSAVATFTSTTLSGAASHKFYAVYSGDSNYATSTSSTVTTPAASTGTTSTTTTVSAASTSVASGATDLLSATVTPSTVVNSTAPTGTVTFTSSTQGVLCSGTVSANAASCTATLTTSGVQSITATYSGDANYATSVSATPAAVTVAATSVSGTLTLSVAPGSSLMYGATVTLTSVLTGAGLTTAPTGTVTFTLVGTVGATYTATINATTSSSGTATYTLPTPVPGTYTITATCTSPTVTCTTLSATATLLIIKGNTTTVLTASPTSPQAGQTTTLTATVTPATTVNGGATLPTGTVAFYINGSTPVATQTLNSNGVATYTTVLTAVTGNYVTAVYSGDTNWNGSSSSTVDVMIAPIVTTTTTSANETTALYSTNIVLTSTVLVTPTALAPNPAAPYGSVTFYDLYNGQTVPLGTANLTAIVPGQSIAQLSTTGLMKGTHNITASFNASTAYAASTSSIVINITDYGVTFSPASLSLSQGSGGAAIATVTEYNSFAGQVVLGCTPPPGALMTCSFNPAVLTPSGTSVLEVTTTMARNEIPGPLGRKGSEIALAALSLGGVLFGMMMPASRRKKAYFLAMVTGLMLLTSMGCTVIASTPGSITGGGSGSGTGGTPQGTQLLTITTSGTDGVTTVRHNTQYQVTVQ